MLPTVRKTELNARCNGSRTMHGCLCDRYRMMHPCPTLNNWKVL